MNRSDEEDKSALRQNIDKQKMGDRELQRKSGKPPRKGDPDVKTHDPDVQQLQRKHGTDPDETYRQGRQGPK